ncbi:protein of unknown function [Shewanella benthica]|uniref:Uncharacterized protein n=1 Tax=Shewanella benthica TaxID=43661 RepID=A0A330M1Y1_9GAMM|nr:hypothetical protein [Shewanella benthica]SQH75070.1 protein of unknown function [Shewanella benthica]
MKSRAGVLQKYLHISPLQAIGNNEAENYKRTSQYQLSQQLNHQIAIIRYKNAAIESNSVAAFDALWDTSSQNDDS